MDSIIVISFCLKIIFKSTFFVIFIFIIYNYPYKENKTKITKETYNLIKKINQYIIICKKGILIEGIKKSSIDVIASVVISSFNSAKSIKSAIRSIQNQKMSDIEIIIVDDYSFDNSLEIIRELQIEDDRIKILSNKMNRGALYTKCIGFLKASGRYILSLDSDDLFINNNIFNICYKHAEKGIDIIEFSGFYSNCETLEKNKKPMIPYYLKYKNNNEVITQPRLSNFIYEQENNTIIRLIDGYICAKFIKTKILQKSIKFLGDWIYSEKVNYGDDRIINFILFKIADSFEFINEYGLIYYNNTYSITNSIKYIEKCHDELITIMSLYNMTKKNDEIKYAVYELLSRWNTTIYIGLNQNNKQYAKKLIKFILKSRYIKNEDKKKIKILLKDLN